MAVSESEKNDTTAAYWELCAIKCQHRGADADYPAHSEQRENRSVINMSSPLAALRLSSRPRLTMEEIVKKLMGQGSTSWSLLEFIYHPYRYVAVTHRVGLHGCR